MIAPGAMLDQPGTHATFTEHQIRNWLVTRAEAGDRADWAVIRLADGAYLGEGVWREAWLWNGVRSDVITMAALRGSAF